MNVQTAYFVGMNGSLRRAELSKLETENKLKEGKLYQRLKEIEADSWDDGDDVSEIRQVIDEAKAEIPKLTVIAGIPLWEKFFEDEEEWRKKWFGVDVS